MELVGKRNGINASRSEESREPLRMDEMTVRSALIQVKQLKGYLGKRKLYHR